MKLSGENVIFCHLQIRITRRSPPLFWSVFLFLSWWLFTIIEWNIDFYLHIKIHPSSMGLRACLFPFPCLSVCLSICLSLCLSVWPCVCLSVWDEIKQLNQMTNPALMHTACRCLFSRFGSPIICQNERVSPKNQAPALAPCRRTTMGLNDAETQWRRTVGQNRQEYRLEYWATHSSVHSFACTAHSFACSTLLASFAY